MLDFSFNGVSLSSFGGRVMEAPMHTIAKRDKTFDKIYGQSGDELIDNGSYNNVEFSVKIGFFTFVSRQTAQQLAQSIINWLAPLQDGYYVYRDSENAGYFTQAALVNFDQIQHEMRTFLTATLSFNRVPFWYSDDGTTEIRLDSGLTDYTITNPTAFDAEPVYQFIYGRPNTHEIAEITINGITTTALLPVADETYYFDNVLKQMYVIQNGEKNYVGSVLLPNLTPGDNIINYRLNTVGVGSFRMIVAPNWRRL